MLSSFATLRNQRPPERPHGHTCSVRHLKTYCYSEFPQAAKKEHNASIVKTYDDEPPPHFMIHVVQEFLGCLYWKLRNVLDEEGITMLQWAFMERATDRREGVSFSWIMEVTGESKDNVRRAAASLQGFANVVVDPRDRRSRKLVLTKRGRRRIGFITMRLEKEMLNLLGARDRSSQRAEQFKELLWEASAYLTPGDLACEETIERSNENRKLIPDDSTRFDKDAEPDSIWIKEDPPEDWIPF
jgi:DNA-binding MarR family transcriptional regulator